MDESECVRSNLRELRCGFNVRSTRLVPYWYNTYMNVLNAALGACSTSIAVRITIRIGIRIRIELAWPRLPSFSLLWIGGKPHGLPFPERIRRCMASSPFHVVGCLLFAVQEGHAGRPELGPDKPSSGGFRHRRWGGLAVKKREEREWERGDGRRRQLQDISAIGSIDCQPDWPLGRR